MTKLAHFCQIAEFGEDILKLGRATRAEVFHYGAVDPEL